VLECLRLYFIIFNKIMMIKTIFNFVPSSFKLLLILLIIILLILFFFLFYFIILFLKLLDVIEEMIDFSHVLNVLVNLLV